MATPGKSFGSSDLAESCNLGAYRDYQQVEPAENLSLLGEEESFFQLIVSKQTLFKAAFEASIAVRLTPARVTADINSTIESEIHFRRQSVFRDRLCRGRHIFEANRWAWQLLYLWKLPLHGERRLPCTCL